jgi:Spy/CpxP family protein refolding chaperone
MKKLSTLILAASLVSSAAAAQVTSLATANPAPKSNDPNRIVCDVEQTTGTRLGARKVCKTAFEWAQMKRDQRETLEKVQQQATSTGIPAN